MAGVSITISSLPFSTVSLLFHNHGNWKWAQSTGFLYKLALFSTGPRIMGERENGTLPETNSSHPKMDGWNTTLPETSIAPEKYGLEDYSPFGMAYSHGLC